MSKKRRPPSKPAGKKPQLPPGTVLLDPLPDEVMNLFIRELGRFCAEVDYRRALADYRRSRKKP